MKKLLLISLLLFVLKSAFAQTNVYHPFPESNAVWNESFRIWGCNFWPYYHEERYSYVMTGDTVIGATTFHKLEWPFIQLMDTCFGNFPMNYPGYAGAIMQDTAARKIFYVHPNQSNVQLLYDFSLQLGDTVLSSLVSSCPNTTIVTNIDSILINGSYRKQFTWYGSQVTTVVEGIGSLNGLLDISCGIIDGPEFNLGCFKENNVVMYTNPSFADSVCATINGIKNIDDVKTTTTIFPNPFHNTAELRFDNTRLAGDKIELKIYNTMGELVREEEILPVNSYILHRAGLSDGLYFYELRTHNYGPVDHGKFVIE